ncbi:MAG: Lrp/AsnC family transcriptional regulator [Steroidobacteraceae bacterium]
MPKSLDRLDRRILDELQADARISNQELAQRVGLSPAPCWRRLRRLEEDGFIAAYATLLSAPAIGLPIQAYALI